MRLNGALVDLLGSIAQQKNATPAQIALAWLLASEDSSIVYEIGHAPALVA